jgi:putative tryptophan/tyrosine transport system substrate-binding protein
MRRRDFIKVLGGAATAWPLTARAQTSGKTLPDRLGYDEGKNIVIHYRWAEGRYDRLPELASELAKLNVDVIVTHSTPGSRAAKEATSTIPIVMAAVIDPVETGLVPSLHRPGGNLTGLTFFVFELYAKRVELIREAIPTLMRAAVLINPANPA